MQSLFTSPRPNAQITNASVDETYTLAGLNLRDPDEIMTGGETYFTINSRMFARNDDESRVANRTRKGAGFLNTAVGETANVSNAGTSTGDASFTTTQRLAQPFTPNASGCLTTWKPNIKKASGATGHVIIEIYSDVGGFPGVLLAQSSILASSITTAYQDLPAYFIEAPTMTSSTQYWAVYYIQDNGSGSYYINQTAGSVALLSIDSGSSWSSLGVSTRYKSYISTTGKVQGYHLRYPSTASGLSNLILFAQNGNIYSTTKAGATPTLVDSGLSTTAPIRFAQVDDMTIWVDGTHAARWWDGINSPLNMPGVPSTNPSNVIIWQNRAFFMTDVTRVDFSDLNNFTSFTSTNFFYIGSPKSPDHMTGWIVFQDNLTVFTHETKYLVIGSNISNFTFKEAVGTKGTVSQESMCSDRNSVYFIADDGNDYAWNGATDTLLSDKVQPELSGIVDKTQIRQDVYRNQLRLYYAKAPSSFSNQMLLYDLELQQWFMDTSHPVVGSTSLYLDNQQLIEFSSLGGQVFFGEIQFSDLGRKLDWKYWTNYKGYSYRRRTGQTFGGGSAKKRIKRFHPVVRTEDSDYTMLVGKDMDFNNTPDMREYIISGGGAKWGQFVWGDGTRWGKQEQISNLSGMSGRGKYIQYRFERSGVETPAELYGYISQYKVGSQR